MEFVVFAVFAAISVTAALFMVLQRNAMYSALFLVLNFFCFAVFFILLGAYFLAVVQVAVYAGAIMVLMLFVIMLLNVAYPEPLDKVLGFLRPFGVVTAVVFAVVLAGVGLASKMGDNASILPTIADPSSGAGIMLKGVGAAEAGHVQEVAATLFSRYLFPFEVTSVLLLAAILGASVLVRKRTEHA
ncbi:MAG: NADH-quinone oxidoreductase subunit J [Chloroflexota bacterium]|jgi:NADH-quinone oxidoreductase subunit J|nr:NADH-quinone oxidoreductase subunit J [Chloroflexota bacterium]